MADTIGTEVKEVKAATSNKVPAPTAPKLNVTQQRIEDARDKANWEWITVPEHDLFGQVHDGVRLNFELYGPGKHFVDPVIAEQLRTQIDGGLKAQRRIMQPQTDIRYKEIMQKMGRTPATNPNF